MSRKVLVRALLSALVTALAVIVVPSAHAAGTGSITGSVTVPAGYDIRAVRVAATPTGSPANTSGAPGAWVQPDGTFSITGLSSGMYNVSFGTYWSDMNPCSANRDRWWTSPGVATGTCQGGSGIPTGAGTITVSDGVATALGNTPVLDSFPLYHHTGRVLAPPGHSVAGVQVELWSSEDGAWGLPSGWYRLTSVPVQTLTADGTFDFPLIDGPWSHGFTLRFVDQPANGYVFSFSTGGHTSADAGQGGAAFGAGSIGLLAIPTWAYADVDLGTQQAKYAIGYASGGVSITGTPEWGRTLTAHSNVVWSDPTVGTSYQWYRNGAVVDGATGPTFAMETMDDGWGGTMSVQARPAGAWAYTGSPIQSPDLTITNTTPFSSTAPKVAGTAQVGRTLTASNGAWHPTAATYTYAYQWFRGSSSIPGATKPSYLVTAADLGQKLHVRVSVSRPPDCPTCAVWFTGPGTAVSVAGPAVARGVIASSWIAAWPTKVASAKAGTRARIHPFRLTAAGKLQKLRATYQWFVGGKPVKGATGTSYRVPRSAKHKAVVLRITLTKPGYGPRAKNVSFGKAR